MRTVLWSEIDAERREAALTSETGIRQEIGEAHSDGLRKNYVVEGGKAGEEFGYQDEMKEMKDG